MLLRLSCLAFCVASPSIFSLAQDAPSTPQPAQVTFYSNHDLLKTQIPGNRHGMFTGRIMDGDKQLAMLRPDRFVTFNLDPGEHTLTATSWMGVNLAGGGHLKISLLPGHHYYVGAYTENAVAVIVFRLEQRTCEQAQAENKTTKPLKQEHIKDYGLTRVVAESSFPTCPPNSPTTPSSPTAP